MPFPRTWIEELVAESLQLEGFLVETGFPTITAKQGGRHEADIVGARVRRGKMEICHCEVSEWLNSGGAKQQAIDYASRKFSPQLCKDIERRFCRKFGLRRANSYHKIVISKQVPKGFSEKLKQLVSDCQVLILENFIFERAATSMN